MDCGTLKNQNGRDINLLESAAKTLFLDEARSALAARLLPDALRLFDLAELKGEDANRCAGGRWETFMLMGDFEAAWKQTDALRMRNAPDPHRMWNGESLGGRRVILRCLHGFGDAIQMLRYTRKIQQVVSSLTVQVAPVLVSLANCIDGVSDVVTWDELEAGSREDWDMQIEVMELPYIFRSTIGTLPSRAPYLHLPVADVKRISRSMATMEGGRKQPRIGICWSCGAWDRSRAIPFPLFLPLLGEAYVQFYNLQDGIEGRCWQDARLPQHCHDANLLGSGLTTLAATIANLDLVITVDTMAAHLAAALGKPVWLLLQYASDWRWMHERESSPWYPSMKIFRQRTAGDWSTVLADILEKLARFVQGNGINYAALG